jgi:hypothetical protein
MQTENGAASLVTTESKLLDFFFKTVRSKKITLETKVDSTRKHYVSASSNTAELFKGAFAEDADNALRALVHLRDPRGLGKGEKLEFFRALDTLPTEIVGYILSLMPEYGSYGDLNKYYRYTYLSNRENKEAVLNIIIDLYSTAIVADKVSFDKNEKLSLAAKWIPSNGSKLDKSTDFITRFMKKTTLSRGQYRKLLSALRARLIVTESLMSSGKFDQISYTCVPSRAMKLYRKAFSKRDQERFCKFLENVASGKTTIKSAGLMPHEIVKEYMSGHAYDEVLELQWKALSNQFSTHGIDGLCISDVSSSMNGIPMEVSIALGILVAENSSSHKNKIITFSENPEVFTLQHGDSLFDKVRKLQASPWGGSTDFQKVFKLILNAAKLTGHVPETLFVFSDMQFNEADGRTNFDAIDSSFVEAGITRPKIVFWNLRGDTPDFPVSKNVTNCALVSGFSSNLLKIFMTSGIVSPWAVMMDVLGNARYANICVPGTQVSE